MEVSKTEYPCAIGAETIRIEGCDYIGITLTYNYNDYIPKCILFNGKYKKIIHDKTGPFGYGYAIFMCNAKNEITLDVVYKHFERRLTVGITACSSPSVLIGAITLHMFHKLLYYCSDVEYYDLTNDYKFSDTMNSIISKTKTKTSLDTLNKCKSIDYIYKQINGDYQKLTEKYEHLIENNKTINKINKAIFKLAYEVYHAFLTLLDKIADNIQTDSHIALETKYIEKYKKYCKKLFAGYVGYKDYTPTFLHKRYAQHSGYGYYGGYGHNLHSSTDEDYMNYEA